MSDYNNENIFSKRLRAGKRRTYFFDVRTTKNNDYFVTLTESKKRYDGDGYDRHKIFLYKEDFNKFIDALNETINHVKTELMPDFDFDAFNHDDYDESSSNAYSNETPTETTPAETPPSEIVSNDSEPADTEPETVAEPVADIAEELDTPAPTQDASFTNNQEIDNPSANDEAETW